MNFLPNLKRRLVINLNMFLSNRLNISVIRKNRLNRLSHGFAIYRKIRFFEKTNLQMQQWSALIEKSTSQLSQDFFALYVNDFKKNGYFVEFGATDGIDGSNTFLLEKEFNWNGILAEPARIWLKQLAANRECNISDLCVYSRDGDILRFSEVSNNPVLSTINSKLNHDFHNRKKNGVISYDVKTISLLSLLDLYKAPKEIDFLSIDTEGTEFEILSVFDFSKYSFNAICVEHNYQKSRKKIRRLLETNGYINVFQEFSEFDDWYIRAPIKIQR